MIVRKLFEDNKRNFTEAKDEQVVPCVIFVEEAQNVLSEEHVRTSANPFVRIAKEGRKFGIGLVAITQRPSAISEEIRSQAENFFAFYMGNSDDIKALVKSNINYDGVISSFIQRETRYGVPVKWGTTAPLNEYDDAKGFVFNVGGASGTFVNVGGNEYRAEIDGAFLRFLYVESGNYWEVTDKSGNKFYFGEANDPFVLSTPSQTPIPRARLFVDAET